MGWQVGWDPRWQRDIGYGVPAVCDRPACGLSIDRGLGYVCGGEPYGGDKGCGLFFCEGDLFVVSEKRGRQLCTRCLNYRQPYEPTPDVQEWTDWKMTDESWAAWRAENGHPEPVRV